MTTPDSLFSFQIGECGVGSYEINTADWVIVLCLNGSKKFFWFQLKTKELTIDGGNKAIETGMYNIIGKPSGS